MSKARGKTAVTSASAWQKWAKKRAQNAPSHKRAQEISKKVKISVTQLLLEERRSE